MQIPGATPRRVALIGTGWYGKSDLFRLCSAQWKWWHYDADRNCSNRRPQWCGSGSQAKNGLDYIMTTVNYYPKPNPR
ncbi:MAG: hypothetical protein WKI04_13100 [Ferruginibacter sp.]